MTVNSDASNLDTMLYICEAIGYVVLLCVITAVVILVGNLVADYSLGLGFLYLLISPVVVVYSLYRFQQRVIGDGLNLGMG